MGCSGGFHIDFLDSDEKILNKQHQDDYNTDFLDAWRSFADTPAAKTQTEDPADRLPAFQGLVFQHDNSTSKVAPTYQELMSEVEGASALYTLESNGECALPDVAVEQHHHTFSIELQEAWDQVAVPDAAPVSNTRTYLYSGRDFHQGGPQLSRPKPRNLSQNMRILPAITCNSPPRAYNMDNETPEHPQHALLVSRVSRHSSPSYGKEGFVNVYKRHANDDATEPQRPGSDGSDPGSPKKKRRINRPKHNHSKVATDLLKQVNLCCVCMCV